MTQIMDEVTYVLFADTVGSTGATMRDQHFLAVQEALQQSGDDLIDFRRQFGDEHFAKFKSAAAALQASARIHNIGCVLPYGLSERISLDVGPAEGTGTEAVSRFGRDYYQTISRAKRIMEICPGDFTLCSEDFWISLPHHEREALPTPGSFYAKLKSFVCPLSLYCIPQIPEHELEIWHARRKVPVWADITGFIRAGGYKNFFAEAIPIPAWYLSRDRGHYKLGKFWFYSLYVFSRLVRWKRLEFHNLVGLSDVSMLDEDRDKALRWHDQSRELAIQLGEKSLLSITTYQRGHRLAHFEPSDEAERLLRASYSGFEELGDPRWAGWAAIYLGRCLRGLGKNADSEKMKEAENWILAGIVVLVSRGVHKRQLAYALIQMARLRARQRDYHQARWYIEKASQLDHKAVRQAADDAPWEEELRSIQQKAANYPGINDHLTSDDLGIRIAKWAVGILERRSVA